MEVDVVLSGSSTRYVAHIGWLSAVEDLGFDIKRIAATSGGAMVSSLWALGMSTDEIWDRTLRHDFTEFINLSWVSKVRLFLKGYLSNGKKFYKILCELTDNKKIGDVKIPLYITASNYCTHDLVIFNQDTHSSLKIADALYMSCSMPGGFKPMIYGGHVYKDGCIHKNYPWDIWPGSPRLRIGHLVGHGLYSSIESESWNGVDEIEAFIHNTTYANVNEALRDGPKPPRGITTMTGALGIHPFKFDISDAEKDNLRNEGYNNAIANLKHIVEEGQSYIK